MLAPTRVNCPSPGAAPQKCRDMVFSLLRLTGSPAGKWNAPASRCWTSAGVWFVPHSSSFTTHQMLPKPYEPPTPKHTQVYFSLCHIAVAIDWNATDQFHISLICTYRLLASLSAMLGAEADGWLHGLRKAQQQRISQFPTKVSHIKSS